MRCVRVWSLAGWLRFSPGLMMFVSTLSFYVCPLLCLGRPLPITPPRAAIVTSRFSQPDKHTHPHTHMYQLFVYLFLKLFYYFFFIFPPSFSISPYLFFTCPRRMYCRRFFPFSRPACASARPKRRKILVVIPSLPFTFSSSCPPLYPPHTVD